MNCEQASELFGQHVDGELPRVVSDELKKHVERCTSCRVEVAALTELAGELAAGPSAPVPDMLWTAIEKHLPDDSRIAVGAPSHSTGRPVLGSRWRRHIPLALAAAVLFVIGLSVFGPVSVDSSAQASVIDFSVLLDALPVDAKKAFRKFLVLYGARESTPMAAKRFAPDLNFNLPEELPGGYRLDEVYVLRFGKNPGVAATYEREGDFIGTVFHPPVNRENYGPHSEYPCMVGNYEGHKVSVGQWRLFHLMDPTTCHCVLSRLDETSELSDIMTAVAPKLRDGTTHHEDCSASD